MKIENLSRRQFIKGSALAGGGLILGFTLPMVNKALARQGDVEKATYPIDSWIQIDQQGRVNFVIPVSEMGQGSQTALAMILADEIGADYSAIQVKNPTNNPLFNNPMFGMQLTGGSTAVRAWWEPLRVVGATARGMLIEAAAKQWNVAASNCNVQDSFVTNKQSGTKLHFRELVKQAASLSPPDKPQLKKSSDYQYIGKPMKRIDTPAKVNGEAVFGIDVVVPGMLVATVKQSPVFGGEVDKYDKAAAMKVKGVKAVVPIDHGIAVVANSYWQAKKGLDVLNVSFKGGLTEGFSTKVLERAYDDALFDEINSRNAFSHGNAKDEMKNAHDVHAMKYHAPYLAHTTMEPMNATAHVTADKCEIWAPTQAQSMAVQTAMNLTGLHGDQITLHTTFLGGGFGRRAEIDYIAQAITLSEEVEAPVKVIWSREEDIQHDFYRPAASSAFEIGVDKQGYPLAWKNRVTNSSIMRRYAPDWMGDKPDATMTEGAAEMPYGIPNQTTDVVELETDIPVGFWRSVGNSLNCFFVESALDELAHHANKDPLDYRRHLLKDSPRALNVLNAAARHSGWNDTLPAGTGRGVAITHSFGSYVAEVAEVTAGDDGKFTVDRIVCVVDCGLYINPSIVKRQMQSSIIYGLTAALYGKINFHNGQVVESNFHNYPALSLAEIPEIDVHIIESDEKPGGYGEPGTPPVAPAVANALFAASGKRHQTLPLKPRA
jgi:isoquinoline 1-oxidoreductase beta subunit